MAGRDKGSFLGNKIRIGNIDQILTDLRKEARDDDRTVRHAHTWANRRPICPYGCEQEGELVEVIVKDGRALGIYKDSEQLIFTADLEMLPNPKKRVIKIGANGEPYEAEEED